MVDVANDFDAPTKVANDFDGPAPSVPISTPDGVPSQPIEGPVANTLFSRGHFAAIGKAFGTGWTEGLGPDPFNLDGPVQKDLAKYGITYDRDKGGPPTVLNAMGEAFIRPAVAAVSGAVNAFSGALRAVGDAVLEAGVPRDIVALPGAFQGSPGALGKVEFRPGLGKDVRAGIPVEPARVERPAPPPPEFQDIDFHTQKVGPLDAPPIVSATGNLRESGPYQMGTKTVSVGDTVVTKADISITADEVKIDKIVTLDAAQRKGYATQLVDDLIKEYPDKTITTSMRTDKGQAFFKDFEGEGNGLRERGPKPLVTDLDVAQDLGKVEFRPGLGKDVRAGIPTETAKPLVEAYHGSSATFESFDQTKAPFYFTPSEEAAAGYAKSRAGEPNVRPVQLKMENPYEVDIGDVEGRVNARKPEWLREHGYDSAILRDSSNPRGTEYIVLDKEQVTSGAAKPLVTDLDVAQDLGTIGPEKPTAFEEHSAKQRTMNADNPAGKSDVVRSEPVYDPTNPAVDKAGNIRLDLIETSADANNVLRGAAEANGGYQAARRGEISLGHQEQLSQVLGIPVEKLDLAGIGRRLTNDADLRVSIQAMVQSSEQVVTLAREAHLSGDPQALIKFQEAWMRHDVLQEHVAGLTAEWGRTGNVFQEFRERVKDTNSLGDFLREKGKGRGVNDLKDMVEKIGSLSPDQIPRFLADARKPGFWDKVHYYWVNSILSGQFSQATYLISDAMFATYDNLVIKPLAGVVGAVRGEGKAGSNFAAEGRAYIGEGPAGFYGYLAGAPEGIRAAWETLKTGQHPALPREITLGTKNPVTEQRPIGGVVGTIVGAPSRELSMIHALQSNMAYRSQIHSLAYREAAKATGEMPWTDTFRNHMKGLVDFPTEAMMDEAVTYSQRMTFTDPLIGSQKSIAKVMKGPVMRFITPFANVPMNTLNAAIEGTPLSWMNEKMRANLKGKNGKLAQDTQIARLAAGSAVMGLATYWAMSDQITGNGPINPEDRAIWLLTHSPNSVKIGDRWVSFDKFAPLGVLLGLGADMVEVGKSVFTDKEAGEAASHLAVAASNMVLNNTGMKGLYDLVSAFSAKDKEKELTKWVNNFAASFMPFSSATGQIASMMDPNIRDVQSLLDAAKNKIPGLREDLFPVRDWSGIVRANTRSEWGALFKNQAVNMDPVDREMESLNLKIDKISKHVSVGAGFSVELTPTQYDRLQDVAGVVTRQSLNSLVQQDGWYQLPAPVREEAIRNSVNAARKYAIAMTKMQSVGTADDIVRKGNEQRIEWMTKK